MPSVASAEKTIRRYLQFRVGHEEYAVPLLQVREVIALPEITPLPHAPAHFRGIFNLRGQVISVADLRLKLNLNAEDHHETTVILCDIGTTTLGVVVDEVNCVLELADSDIQPRPETASGQALYITGVVPRADELVVLIDLQGALNL